MKYFWHTVHSHPCTVEAWYKGRNGTFESVPYIRLSLISDFGCLCCLFHPNSTWYIPIKALLHCKLSILPSYTIRTKILLCNWQNFNYLDIFHTKKIFDYDCVWKFCHPLYRKPSTSTLWSFIIFLLVSGATFATWSTASLHQNWIIHLLSAFEVFLPKFVCSKSLLSNLLP